MAMLLDGGLLHIGGAQQELMWLTWKSHAEVPLPSEGEGGSRDQTSQMPAFPRQCMYLMLCASGERATGLGELRAVGSLPTTERD